MNGAVHVPGHHPRLADRQLEALAPHLFDEDRQRELAPVPDLPLVRSVGGEHSDRDVADEFGVEAVLDLARGELVAGDLAGQRGRVDADGHGDGGVVDADGRQRPRILGVDEAVADGDVGDARHGGDVAGPGDSGGLPGQAVGREQFGDVDLGQGPVLAGPPRPGAFAEFAGVDPDEREPPEEGRGVEVGHLGDQRRGLVVDGRGDVVEDRLEERFEVGAGGERPVLGPAGVGPAGFGRAVDDGDLQEAVEGLPVLVFQVGAQGQEEVLGFVDDGVDARVRAVDLVDDRDDGQPGLQGLAQDEPGLRQRPLRGVDEEDDAVDHGQPSLDLAAEVGVPGGVDDVDGHASGGAEPGGRGARVADGGVLGEDRDALFAFEIPGVQDPLAGLLHRRALSECAGLP